MRFLVLLLCAYLAFAHEVEVVESHADEDRVYGGTNATQGAFPYVGSLQFNRQHICGVSIIGSNWLLTAAHCVTPVAQALNFTVELGSTVIGSGTTYNIQRIVVHPAYSEALIRNDIALIKLNETITFNNNTRPIRLSRFFELPGRRTIFPGWGEFARGNNDTSTTLQSIESTTISTLRCALAGYGVPVGLMQICTATRNDSGICNGDSGGPLVDAVNGRQLGIASFGSAECAIGKPDVFTRVSSYNIWIAAVTGIL